MRVDVFSLFPHLVDTFASESLLGRARDRDLLDLRTHDIRDAATDRHRTVDDTPFGGGAGMVLMAEPVVTAIEATDAARPLYLLGPGGRRLDQQLASDLAGLDGFSLLCGRYEGIDHRVRGEVVDGEISIGDYVLAGGEVAALVVLEAVSRLVPGVLGNDASAGDESFIDGLLEYPHYTRPADFRDDAVPPVLLSGDHGKVAKWRRAHALARTQRVRPDLIEARGGLSDEERKLVEEYGPTSEMLETWDQFAYPAKAQVSQSHQDRVDEAQ